MMGWQRICFYLGVHSEKSLKSKQGHSQKGSFRINSFPLWKKSLIYFIGCKDHFLCEHDFFL